MPLVIVSCVGKIYWKLREPDGVTTAVGIFDRVCDNVEAIEMEQVAILRGVEACVVEGLSVESSHGFSVRRSAGKHESGAGRGMFAEDGKHGALVVVREVKEAVPCEQTIKETPQRKSAHVYELRFLMGEIVPEEVNHLRRSVDAGDSAASFYKMAGEGLS